MEFSHNIVQTSNTYALPGNLTIYVFFLFLFYFYKLKKLNREKQRIKKCIHFKGGGKLEREKKVKYIKLGV